MELLHEKKFGKLELAKEVPVMNKLAKYAMVEREKKRTNWETAERDKRKYFFEYFLAG